MTDRDQGSPEGRRSVLDDEQRSIGTRLTTRPGGGRSGAHRLLPLLVFALIALLIAHNEIPAVRDWWDRTFSPEEWAARRTCQQGALARAPNKAYARVIDAGDFHRTSDGVYIDGLVLGEMGDAGSEVRVEYTCYLNAAGDLVKVSRTRMGPAHAAPADDVGAESAAP